MEGEKSIARIVIFCFLTCFTATSNAQSWIQKHYFLLPKHYPLEELKTSSNAKTAEKAVQEQNLFSLEQGLEKTFSPPATSAVFLAEMHELGAGRIGYYRLLTRVYERFPFSCFFWNATQP